MAGALRSLCASLANALLVIAPSRKRWGSLTYDTIRSVDAAMLVRYRHLSDARVAQDKMIALFLVSRVAFKVMRQERDNGK